MASPQLYINGLPIFTQDVHLDSLNHSIEVQSATNVVRAMDGSLWVQSIYEWKKRKVTITGQGLPTDGFSDHLYALATYIHGNLIVSGVIVSVNGPDRDVWEASDNWSIVIEET